jgi:hypothetical protein
MSLELLEAFLAGKKTLARISHVRSRLISLLGGRKQALCVSSNEDYVSCCGPSSAKQHNPRAVKKQALAFSSAFNAYERSCSAFLCFTRGLLPKGPSHPPSSVFTPHRNREVCHLIS